MTTIGNDVASSSAGGFVLAFAKLQGENFEYYMQKYSIILGRSSRKNSVDLNLRRFGGCSLAISRRHARIYYDFNFRYFALEVLGRNGCIVRDNQFMPGSAPIKLKSQDLIQMGEVRFYFLLPSRPFLVTPEAARQVVPPLPPILVAVPVASSNDEKKGEERESNRGENRGVEHGEGDVDMIVEEPDAREAEHSFDVPSGGALDTAGQIAPPLLPPLVMVPPTSNNEMKGEERKGEGEKSLRAGHGSGLGDMIVEESSAREAGGSSSEVLGAGEAAKQIELPLTPKLVVVPLACISNERKGKEKEGDREESQGTGHVEGGVSGLVVEEFSAGEAGGSSSEQYAAFKAAMQKESPLLPQLVSVPFAASNEPNYCEEKEGESEEITGVEHGDGDGDVCGLIAEEFSARESEGSPGGLSGALEAAREIAPSPHSPLSVVPPTYSNNERKGKERDGDREEILGMDHGKGGESGVIVEEFSVREADGFPGMHSGDMEHFNSPNEKLEPRLSDREADNQEETPDAHAFKADLPGIKKQIKPEVEHVDCAHAGDQEP